MPDDAILAALAKREQAENRIKKLERAIKKWRNQITEINNFIRTWEKFSGRQIDSLTPAKSITERGEFVPASEGKKVRVTPANSRKEKVTEVAEQVLAEAGRTLTRSELYKALVGKGLTIQGANPEMVLSTMLWRTKDTSRVQRLKSGGYSLKEHADPSDVDDNVDGSENDKDN